MAFQSEGGSRQQQIEEQNDQESFGGQTEF